MSAPMKPGAACARSVAAMRVCLVQVEHLLATRPAVSTREIVGAINRSTTRATTIAAAMGLARSDEHPDHRRGAPVYHARDLETAIAAERAWLAARAARSPVAKRRQAASVAPRRVAGGMLSVVAVDDLRDPGDVFACRALGAKLSALSCVARQRSERPECHVCRDCATGREVARRTT